MIYDDIRGSLGWLKISSVKWLGIALVLYSIILTADFTHGPLWDTIRNTYKGTQQFVSLWGDQLCTLDPKSEVFAGKRDDYGGPQMPEEKIYPETFTYTVSEILPVIPDPIIRLHQSRFILPILAFGPNNQLIGFRESIYIAIKLNRTIVIPMFFKHYTDTNGKRFLHPTDRLDFDTLCRFISCITLHQFGKACGNQADVIFHMRHYSKELIGKMEKNLGMLFWRRSNGNNSRGNLIPTRLKKKALRISPNEDEIQRLFSSKKRCAIAPLIFKNLKISSVPSTRRITSTKDLTSFTNTEIFSEIIRNTPWPRYIGNISDDFVKSIMRGENFLSVHWRFNEKDWMRRCNRFSDNTKLIELCREIRLVHPYDLASAITKKIERLEPELSRINNIYIAAPPSEIEFIMQTKQLLNQSQRNVFHLTSLHEFLRQNYSSCKFLWDRIGDIESTVELEICSRGTVFLPSPISTWSANVVKRRRHNEIPGTHPEKDEEIMALISDNNKNFTKSHKTSNVT